MSDDAPDLYAYRAIVTGVYDGDSITLDIDLGLRTWRRGLKVRLLGIDAPELRGEERRAGLYARDWLRQRILGAEVIVRTHRDRTGKYGRWLATIYHDGESVNDLLLEAGLAERYP